MEADSIKTLPYQMRINSQVKNSMSMFDISSIIDELKDKQNESNTDIKTRVLLKNKGNQVLLAVMQDATEIDSYQANESITFQIIEGKVKINFRNDMVTLVKDQSFTIEENLNYKLTTKENSVMIITLTGDVFQMASN